MTFTPKETHMARGKRNAKVNTLENMKNSAIATLARAKEAAQARIADTRSRAADVASQLEKAFERRVARSMQRLGVPSAAELHTLAREVEELRGRIEKLGRTRTRA
jgi:poly(hydroxyalkanoate) granule-associated protein